MAEEKTKTYVVEAVADDNGESKFYCKYFTTTTKREALDQFLMDHPDDFNIISVRNAFPGMKNK